MTSEAGGCHVATPYVRCRNCRGHEADGMPRPFPDPALMNTRRSALVLTLIVALAACTAEVAPSPTSTPTPSPTPPASPEPTPVSTPTAPPTVAWEEATVPETRNA